MFGSNNVVQRNIVTACNAGRGRAEAYLGTTQVAVPIGKTNATFTLAAMLPVYQAGAVVSLVATNSLGDTSEIGDCFAVTQGGSDSIFKNGFEP